MHTLNFDFLSTMGLLERLIVEIRSRTDCSVTVTDEPDRYLVVNLVFDTKDDLLASREIVSRCSLCEEIL